MLYASSTGGFYLRAIHGEAIPADAVEITAEEHVALLAGQAAGQIITAGPAGRPILTNPPTSPELTAEEHLAAWRARCSVSGPQMDLALIDRGLAGALAEFLDDKVAAKTVFARAGAFDRMSPFIVALSATFTNPATGELITPEEIDALFRVAEAIDLSDPAVLEIGS